MKMDASSLDRFAAELVKSSLTVQAVMRPVVQKGALNVKTDWQKALAESRSFKGVKHTPTYDTKVTRGGVEAEIGPRTSGRQAGDLVSIAHFGGARGGGGVPDPQTFLDREGPRFEKALGDVIGRTLP